MPVCFAPGLGPAEVAALGTSPSCARAEGEEPPDPLSTPARWPGYQWTMAYVVGLSVDRHSYSTDLIRGLHFVWTDDALDGWPTGSDQTRRLHSCEYCGTLLSGGSGSPARPPELSGHSCAPGDMPEQGPSRGVRPDCITRVTRRRAERWMPGRPTG